MSAECRHCCESLLGKRYVLREEMPTCLTCFNNHFANMCEGCKRPIGVEDRDLSHDDKHWHDICFLCTGCGNTLANQQFMVKNRDLFCTSCYEDNFSGRCDGCGEIFKAGKERMEYKGRKYHTTCFKCSRCDDPIGTTSFFPGDGPNKQTCMTCYNTHVAQKCGGCGEAVKGSGLKYNGVHYHSQCFLCTGCSESLANTKFVQKDGDAYCQACYTNLYSKTCMRCEELITAIGTSAKYYELKGKYIHADCYTCEFCRVTLAGGFVYDDEDRMLCPTCGAPPEEEEEVEYIVPAPRPRSQQQPPVPAPRHSLRQAN